MTLAEVLTEPYVLNTLTGLTVHFVSKIATKYGKKPKKKKLYDELDLVLEGLDFDLDGINILIDFLGNEQVEDYFYTYVTYRTIKIDNGESVSRKISKDDFINTIATMIKKYGSDNHNYLFKECDIKKYLNETVVKIESRIIDKIKDEHQFYFHSLTSIELLLEDIKVINSMMLNKSLESYIDVDYSNYIKIIRNRYSRAHVYGIDSICLDTFYIYPKLLLHTKSRVTDDSNKKTSIEWKNMFRYSNIISVIGGPGYGKTTFVKSLIQHYAELNIYGANRLIPIYIDLKNYFDYKNNCNSYSIIEFLHDSMINDSGLSNVQLPIEGLQVELDKGNCIIFCDALDEVVKDERDQIQQKIIAFFENVNPNNKIIITSRARGFTPHTDYIIEIQSLDYKRAKNYTDKIAIYKQYNFSKSDSKAFLNQAKLLIDNGFLTSFLMLTLLVNIYKSEQELPTTKYMIYKKCVEHIVLQRERKDKKTKYNFNNFNYILKQSSTFEELAKLGFPNNRNVEEDIILENLASKYQSKYGNYASAYNSSEEFLEFCKERTDFYVRGSKELTYKYFHRSFYDFYQAKRVVTKFVRPEDLFNQISNLSKESEVFELLLEILMDVDYDRYSEFIKWMLNSIDADFTNAKSLDMSKFEIVTLLFRELSEVEFVKKYFSQICKMLIAIEDEIDYSVADNISKFIENNGLLYDFISYIESENNIKYYQSILIYMFKRLFDKNELSFFEVTSYDFFDGYISFIRINYYGLNVFTKNMPKFQLVFEGLINIHEGIKRYESELETLYSCLLEHNHENTSYYTLMAKAQKMIGIVV